MLGISALCLATGAADNRTTDTDMPGDAIGALLQELTDEGVCCCRLAAGNDYYAHGGMQGMCYPRSSGRPSVSVRCTTPTRAASGTATAPRRSQRTPTG